MRTKKPAPQVEVTCDHCGSKTELFVASYPDYLKFCRIQTPGNEPIKDCMTDYYKEVNQNEKRLSQNKVW